jgi:chemotaxis signal transduction protein
MNVPLLHCRVAGVDLLLPTTGLRLLSPASDLTRSATAFQWSGEEFPAVPLRERFGEVPEEAGDEAVALFTLEGEQFAVVADAFEGLVPPEALAAWAVPRSWLLRKGAFPYRRFVTRGDLLAAEVSLLPLLLSVDDAGAEERPPLEGQPVEEGTYVVGRIRDQRVALPLDEVVEVLSDLAVTSFPGLPRLVTGLAIHRSSPIPVVCLEPGMETGAFAVLRCRETSFALSLRNAERVRAFAGPAVAAASAASAAGAQTLRDGHSPAGAPDASQAPIVLRADSIWRLV